MSPRCVLRLGKRRSSWEQNDAEKIAAVEFQDPKTGGLDHAPSVYVLDEADELTMRRATIQARAEHTASFTSPPDSAKGTLECDLEGISTASLRASVGTTAFKFTQSNHAELMLASDADVIAVVQRVLQERALRQKAITRDEVLEYVDGRLKAQDAEWESVAGKHLAEVGPWGEAVKKWRVRLEAARRKERGL